MPDTTILHGSNLDVMPTLTDNSVDAIVTDPPYELGFMGKTWDASGIAYNVELWCEALRVLKPGGHLLAFGGSRTYHRLACAIEDAGFEIRDQIMWVYGSGFPKSLNVAKSIEAKLLTGSAQKNALHKLDGERTGGGEVGMYATVAEQGFRSHNPEQLGAFNLDPTTDDAKKWDGWGTALKPAHEPIVVARKPLEGTVAANVPKWGTGALNIDGTRVGTDDTRSPASKTALGIMNDDGWQAKQVIAGSASGRWPANFIHDGSDEVLALAGSAARFFYCAKAGKKERNAGLEHLPMKSGGEATDRQDGTAGLESPRAGAGCTGGSQNHHPTVKPIALMRYLIRLITPPGGTVLDPFAGSGTTLVAATLEGFNSIGIEMTDEYLPIIHGRVAWANQQGGLFDA